MYKFYFIIIVRWNEWPVAFAHNYTALFRSILGVLSLFNMFVVEGKHID